MSSPGLESLRDEYVAAVIAADVLLSAGASEERLLEAELKIENTFKALKEKMREDQDQSHGGIQGATR